MKNLLALPLQEVKVSGNVLCPFGFQQVLEPDAIEQEGSGGNRAPGSLNTNGGASSDDAETIVDRQDDFLPPCGLSHRCTERSVAVRYTIRPIGKVDFDRTRLAAGIQIYDHILKIRLHFGRFDVGVGGLDLHGNCRT